MDTNKNYLYGILINQKAVIENNWDLSLNHIAILEVVRNFIGSKKCQTFNDELGLWYWVKTSKIVQDLPILKIKDQQCRKLIDGLVECKLLEVNPNNKVYQQFYIRLGVNIDNYLYTNTSTSIQKDKAPIYNSIEDPIYKNIEEPLYKSIDNYNTINNSTTTTLPTIKNKGNGFVVPESYSNFSEIWEKWIKYKKSQHNFSFKSADTELVAFQKLIDVSDANLTKAIKCVDTAMAGGYKSYFRLKEEEEKQPVRKHYDVMCKEDEKKKTAIDPVFEMVNLKLIK